MKPGPPVVEIMPWSPQWARRFDRAKAELLGVLPPDSTIDHIGSTSVVGLPAKPVIDILATTSRLGELRVDLRALEELGYWYSPKYFADDPDHLFLRRDSDGRRGEHLHLFHPRSPMPSINRTFRDYLIADEAAAQRYAAAKRLAALDHPDSRSAYGLAKDHVLQQLLIEARAWAARRNQAD